MTDTRQQTRHTVSDRHAKLQSAADNLISAISNVHDATASAIVTVTTVAVLDTLNNAQEGQTFEAAVDETQAFQAAADDFRRLLRVAAINKWGDDEAVRELFVGLEETGDDDGEQGTIDG